MSKQRISGREMKILWGRSGNKCTICRTSIMAAGLFVLTYFFDLCEVFEK